MFIVTSTGDAHHESGQGQHDQSGIFKPFVSSVTNPWCWLPAAVRYTISMTSDTTLIRVPSGVHERVRQIAQARHETFGQVIDLGLDLVEQESFWRQVQTLNPDATYHDEFAAWDASDVGTDEL